MSLPLSKTLDPADFDQLTEELAIVDQYFTSEREQHPMRRWEYAMALRALATWKEGRDYRDPSTIADIGGGGSPFSLMLKDPHPIVIDPSESGGEDLAHYLTTPHWSMDESHPMLQQAVFCLSVIEHVDDLDRFLYHLSCLVAPGGLLFLTFDTTNSPEDEDRYHFHWMRKRIFRWTPELDPQFIGFRSPFVYLPNVTFLLAALTQQNFTLLGEIDGIWHGNQVYDYSFASLALVKRL